MSEVNTEQVFYKTENVDFEKYLLGVGIENADNLKPCDAYLDDLMEYAEKGEVMQGARLPWPKTHNIIRLQDSQLSIWAGESGSGKSLLLGQVINDMIFKNKHIATIASMEMKPKQTLYRMICQAIEAKAHKDHCKTYVNGLNKRLMIFDQLSSVNPNKMMGMSYFAAQVFNTNHVVIDSLTKCGIKRDDYSEQAKFVDNLQWCAKSLGIHIHLVCHMTKAGNGNRAAIRGAGEITDLADNVFIVARNRDKDAEIEKLQIEGHCDNEVINQPCATLRIDKNREYGREVDIGLFLDKESGTYYDEWRDVIPKGVEEMIMNKR